MNQINENLFDESTYFTTWSTVICDTVNDKLKLSNNSIRQIIRVSAPGNNLRLKISNKLGKTNLEIKEINISDSKSQGTGEIITSTLTYLTFNGEKGTIIPPGKDIYSDKISYNIKPLSEIAISIYFGIVPEILSAHRSSRTDSFIEEGYKINNQKFSNVNKITSYFFISDLEISSLPCKKTIVCFGDSITDGSGSTINKQNRWIDLLANKLHLNKETSDIAIINKGLGGDKLVTKGIKRYSDDVLQTKGIAYIIVLIGVNDIMSKNINSDQIISAYKQIIKEAHKNNIFIYAGTILPFGNVKNGIKKRKIKGKKLING